jgi:hypothetical protein
MADGIVRDRYGAILGVDWRQVFKIVPGIVPAEFVEPGDRIADVVPVDGDRPAYDQGGKMVLDVRRGGYTTSMLLGGEGGGWFHARPDDWVTVESVGWVVSNG